MLVRGVHYDITPKRSILSKLLGILDIINSILIIVIIVALLVFSSTPEVKLTCFALLYILGSFSLVNASFLVWVSKSELFLNSNAEFTYTEVSNQGYLLKSHSLYVIRNISYYTYDYKDGCICVYGDIFEYTTDQFIFGKGSTTSTEQDCVMIQISDKSSIYKDIIDTFEKKMFERGAI